MLVRKLYHCCLLLLALCCCGSLTAQIVINEGSNRNYQSIADENGDYPDWIELYNAGPDTVSLYNYSLTDNESNPIKWVFPNIAMPPGEHKIVFCSGKDRKPISGFVNVVNTGVYNPVTGWNVHNFSTPFYWDGVSNILISTCSYSSAGYTSNSVFNQTVTPFRSSVFSFQDGSEAACFAAYGGTSYMRPNIQLNGITIGNGTAQNSPTDYPAPYGNWWWGAKNQLLYLASELTAAGLTAGFIQSIAFDVVSTDPNTVYNYIDMNMKPVSFSEINTAFETVDPNNWLHTNFKIGNTGEKVSLYSPEQVLLSNLFVNCKDLDNSAGLLPDASGNVVIFQTATPQATNNLSEGFTSYLISPGFSVASGMYNEPFLVSISNGNGPESSVFYTTNGTDPTPADIPYTGAIPVFFSSVVKARAFAPGYLPSPVSVASYLLGVNHLTPVLSVVTAPTNLYGPSGIFDNWQFDWQRAAHVTYFDTLQQVVFSQNAGIQVDGGWGGSRYHPQHSFRVELDNGVLGEQPAEYPIIPNRPNRTQYGKIYLRNGSNQYLVLPYKDACQTEMMAGQTNTYYAAWRPVSVYINGAYFGLYELREKLDAEFFEVTENAHPDSIDILSLSAWGGSVLRAVEGSAEAFFDDYEAFNALDVTNDNYWNLADAYFDLNWYTDYIIGASWMGNTDWPGNNIRIYRSNSTNFRWRFCLIDLELAMAPNSWTDCFFDHIQYMRSQDPANPYINIWLKSMQNPRYYNYFINRFADVMNTAYLPERILNLENSFFSQTAIEMQNEYARWGDPNNIAGQMNDFYNNHLIFQSQLAERSAQVRSHIQNAFELPNQVAVTLQVLPEGAGVVRISTVTPNSYPWQGIYFNGVPVTIEAIPNEGYHFLNWGSNAVIADTLNAVFEGNLNAAALTFTAHFAPFATALTPQTGTAGALPQFTLYPNPAAHVLYITRNYPQQADQNLSVQITDLTGRIVCSGMLPAGTATASIDLRQLPASVYVVQIAGGGTSVARYRFVKITTP